MVFGAFICLSRLSSGSRNFGKTLDHYIITWRSSVLSKCFSIFFLFLSMDFRSCALFIMKYGFIAPPLCWFQWAHLCVEPSGWQLSHCGTMCILHLPFIVLTVFVCPSVLSILLMGPVMTYSLLLLAFLFLPESLCARLVCYYPFPTLSKEDKACD